MESLSSLFNLQFLMFAEMAVGYALCRLHVVEPGEREMLSRLQIGLLLPASIISAFDIELTADLLSAFVQVLLVSAAVQLVSWALARLLWKGAPQERRGVLQYATLCSNAGFLGNAVALGVYGSLGLLYAQFYLIPLRIMMWTAGVSCFDPAGSHKGVWRKLLTHPCIVAIFIGLVRMVLPVALPQVVDDVLVSLGRCSTPLIMLYLGMILGEFGFSGLLSRLNLKYCAVRLLLIPGITLAGCVACGLDPLVSGLSVVLAAMPAGATTALLAEQYHADGKFAADCVVLSTLFSIALLPAWVYLLSAVGL